MSVVSYEGGDLFVIRVIKYLATNPENKWANSYEFRAAGLGTSAELFSLGDILFDFEKRLHAAEVQFDRYIVSTWEQDSVPYQPENFVSVPLSGQGSHDFVGSELVTTGMAWRVNRQAASGRFGNLFYRGSLFEGEVAAPSGRPVLSTPSDQGLLLGTAVDDSLLGQYFGTVGGGQFQMVMINATGTQVRVVNQLVSSGVSLIKQDHMWFNRTVAPE